MKKISMSLLLIVWINFGWAQNEPNKKAADQFKLDTTEIKNIVGHGQRILDFGETNKINLDSISRLADLALTRSRQVHSPKWENEALLLKAFYSLKKDDTVAFNVNSQQVINNYHQRGEFFHEAETWTLLGETFYGKLGGGKKSLWCFEHALAIYKQQKSALNIALITQEKAYVSIFRLNDTSGYSDLKHAITLFKKIKAPQYSECQFVLGLHYWKIGETQRAIAYILEAIKGAEANNDKSQLVAGYTNLGVIYYGLHMYPEALKYHQLGMEGYQALKMYNEYYAELDNCVGALLGSARNKEALAFLHENTKKVPPPVNTAQYVMLYASYGKCFSALKNMAEAEKYFLKMVKVFEASYTNKLDRTNSNSYIQCYRTIGKFYIDTKVFGKAKYYLQKLLVVPTQFLEPAQVELLQYSLFRTDSAAGNFLSAIDHFKQSRLVHDSIFNANKAHQMSELDIKYETRQRLQSIKLLNSEKNEQRNELTRINLQRNIVLGSAFLLLLLAAFAYWAYGEKRKSNELLQAQRKEIDTKNATLETLVLEKDWLLKEVHHRVKNNLQIVMSLLSTQSAYLENKAALDAINESKNRVRVISLIHQKLYSGGDRSNIDISTYIAELVKNLEDGLGTSDTNIYINKNIEPIKIDISQAVPLGLIINEAITNAIKYAFNSTGGTIDVALELTGPAVISLTISDNGKGLPDDFDIKEANSLGMEMMKALSKQLGGTLKFSNHNGLIVTLLFELERMVKDEFMAEILA